MQVLVFELEIHKALVFIVPGKLYDTKIPHTLNYLLILNFTLLPLTRLGMIQNLIVASHTCCIYQHIFCDRLIFSILLVVHIKIYYFCFDLEWFNIILYSSIFLCHFLLWSFNPVIIFNVYLISVTDLIEHEIFE